jgi:hypothetical protein
MTDSKCFISTSLFEIKVLFKIETSYLYKYNKYDPIRNLQNNTDNRNEMVAINILTIPLICTSIFIANQNKNLKLIM